VGMQEGQRYPGVACAPHAFGGGAYMPTEAWLVAEP
jgi:hypothetical protein